MFWCHLLNIRTGVHSVKITCPTSLRDFFWDFQWIKTHLCSSKTLMAKLWQLICWSWAGVKCIAIDSRVGQVHLPLALETSLRSVHWILTYNHEILHGYVSACSLHSCKQLISFWDGFYREWQSALLKWLLIVPDSQTYHIVSRTKYTSFSVPVCCQLTVTVQGAAYKTKPFFSHMFSSLEYWKVKN